MTSQLLDASVSPNANTKSVDWILVSIYRIQAGAEGKLSDYFTPLSLHVGIRRFHTQASRHCRAQDDGLSPLSLTLFPPLSPYPPFPFSIFPSQSSCILSFSDFCSASLGLGNPFRPFLMGSSIEYSVYLFFFKLWLSSPDVEFHFSVPIKSLQHILIACPLFHCATKLQLCIPFDCTIIR